MFEIYVLIPPVDTADKWRLHCACTTSGIPTHRLHTHTPSSAPGHQRTREPNAAGRRAGARLRPLDQVGRHGRQACHAVHPGSDRRQPCRHGHGETMSAAKGSGGGRGRRAAGKAPHCGGMSGARSPVRRRQRQWRRRRRAGPHHQGQSGRAGGCCRRCGKHGSPHTSAANLPGPKHVIDNGAGAKTCDRQWSRGQNM